MPFPLIDFASKRRGQSQSTGNGMIQTNTPLPHSRNTANANNSSPRGATSSTYEHSFCSSNRTLTTRPVATKRNGSHTINCIKTNTNKRALKPAIINKNTEIQAFCDPCSDITVIQQSCVPAYSVIHPSTDGELQVVDHKIKPVGCISLSSNVDKISLFMPKVGICTQLPYLLILGFEWQQQVQCIYEPSGSLCITTPSAYHLNAYRPPDPVLVPLLLTNFLYRLWEMLFYQ
ncbi:hypothetical protein AVEN_134386-1 [Araneus ventricosus]|uniref:Uncharacterized protein n=1 Tax=Araneus ventricosus TaxID=182803 RepID=A0A4Y2JCL5_ARAVE|nr:hypothetical protein AVEN_134386-1 [Araneus ventricosus]